MTHTAWRWLLGISLFLGLWLRLGLPSEIEYKFDEQFMFERSQNVGVTEPWPVLGMKSGKGILNPPLSIWLFVSLKKLGAVTTPEGLSRAVGVLGLLAVIGVVLIGWRYADSEPERRAWLWAAAFAWINPLVVVYERKIWAQSTLPFFCVLVWIAWMSRRTRAGALSWGLLGSLIGQIHMSGFFLSGALFVASVLEPERQRTRWGAWLLGSIPGLVALVPWLSYLIHDRPVAQVVAVSPWEPLFMRFWGFWVGDAFGLHLSGIIGIRSFKEFLSYPLIGGYRTWLAGLAHLGILVILAPVVFCAVREGRFFPKRDSRDPVSIAWWGCGVLLTLTGSVVARSYLLVTHPLEWVWVSRMIRRDRTLFVLWMLQLMVSVIFMSWLSSNHGTTTGEFGVTLEGQRQGLRVR